MNIYEICHQMGIEAELQDPTFLRGEVEWEFSKFFSTGWVQGCLFYEEREIDICGLRAVIKHERWMNEIRRILNLIGKKWADSIVKRLSEFGDTVDRKIVRFYRDNF